MTFERNDLGTQEQAPASPVNAAPAQPQTPDNMVTKERVTELIRENRREVADREYARGREAALAEQRQSAPQAPQSVGGMQAPDEAKIRQMMQEVFTQQSEAFVNRTKQEQQQQHATNLANEVMSKINAAKDRYPELESKIDEIAAFPELISLLNATEDTAGVLNDLIENPLKMAQLSILAQKNSQSALSQMHKLATSIKANEAGKNAPRVNPPLSIISPSIIGMGSDDDSIESIKQQDYLRG